MKTWTDTELTETVLSSASYAEVMRRLDLAISGKSLQHIASHIKRLELNTGHFHRMEVVVASKRKVLTDKDVFCEHSTVRGTRLSTYVKTHKSIEYVCKECGNRGMHNNRVLTLQLDHKNGINNDNRKENLRFLCPNCHTQTETHSIAKHKPIRINNPITSSNAEDMCGKYTRLICDCCGKVFFRKPSYIRSEFAFCTHKCVSVAQSFMHGGDGKGGGHGTLSGYFKCPKPRCGSCKKAMREWSQLRRDKVLEKVDWPSNNELKDLVWREPATSIGKRLGVSSGAIKKRCIKLGISTPSPGYWTKKLPSSTLG